MPQTATQQSILKQERLIGLRASKMAQQYLHAVLKQKLHIQNKGFQNKPLLEATKVKHKMGDYRLLGLNINSNKVGYVLHYGFVGTREATTVYFSDARYTVGKTQRKRHFVNLKPKSIFSNVFNESGAIKYLTAELSKTRTEAINVKINDLILTFNSENNG